MEIVALSESPKQHKWLKWVGLQEPPLDADSWVPVVRGLRISDPAAGTSRLGARLVEELAEARISAQQQSYEFSSGSAYAWGGVSGVPIVGGQAVERVAVMVHERDQSRAIQIAAQLNATLAQEKQTRQTELEADVDREAMEALPPTDQPHDEPDGGAAVRW